MLGRGASWGTGALGRGSAAWRKSGWARRIEHVSQQAETTFVISNNHFESKAAVNSLQLKSMLTGNESTTPESLRSAYPDAMKGFVQTEEFR